MIKKIIKISVALILLVSIGFVGYVNVYYKADIDEIVKYRANFNIDIKVVDDVIVYENNEVTSNTALIFYPGGKVEYTAYEPLLLNLANEGITCFLVKMPYNLAILDIDKAQDIIDEYNCEHLYIAGHSLGGSAAGMYLVDNSDKFNGLILLASYVTSDLSNTDLKVLSIYGENDGVMQRDKYFANKGNLPILDEYVIDGANHAGFAMYGIQKGDGALEIDNIKQIEETASIILEFIK